jgi:site-specific DNA-methyltransferase (adenine-specific)
MAEIKLFLGDCLEVMKTIPAGSVDAIITDIPYGTTACKWDVTIPFVPMWEAIKHVLKPRGVFVTTASQPFTSKLIMSNLDWFKYEWIWDKKVGSTFQLANIMPLRAHENILVFSQNGHEYYPQKILRDKPKDYRNCDYSNLGKSDGGMNHFASKDVSQLNRILYDKFPLSIITISAQAGETNNTNRIHPTQKPVALYEYLICTYANEGETVLDMTMGSGTTMIACLKTGRNGIGIEIDPGYYAIAERRIKEAQMQLQFEGING